MGERAVQRSIVVGIDGSAAATMALEVAIRLAERSGAVVRPVTAWQYPAVAALPGGPDLVSPLVMDDRASAAVDRAVDEVRTRGVAIGELLDTRMIARGPAAGAILDAIDTTVDLVVLGRRGLGGIEGIFLGSVSRRIAELARVPVMLVGDQRVDLTGPVLVGVDSSDTATVARRYAAQMAATLGVGVVVVHGIAGLPMEVPPSAIDHVWARGRRLAEDHAQALQTSAPVPISVTTEVDIADPRHLLARTARTRGASMVVVGSRGEGTAAGLLTGTVVNRMMQFDECPVVIVKAEFPGA